MSEVRVTLKLADHEEPYLPGDTISAEYRIYGAGPHDVKAVELSVLWYTVGQGEEDLAVHFFERLAGEEGAAVDFRAPQHIHTELPHSPLSYDGLLVKVCWCVRVRVFLPRGKEITAEQPFTLGKVSPAKVVTP